MPLITLPHLAHAPGPPSFDQSRNALPGEHVTRPQVENPQKETHKIRLTNKYITHLEFVNAVLYLEHLYYGLLSGDGLCYKRKPVTERLPGLVACYEHLNPQCWCPTLG